MKLLDRILLNQALRKLADAIISLLENLAKTLKKKENEDLPVIPTPKPHPSPKPKRPLDKILPWRR